MKFLTGLIVIVVSAAHAEEIPLKDVWAYRTPGAKDVAELEDAKAEVNPQDTPAEALERMKNSPLRAMLKQLRGRFRKSYKNPDEPLPASIVVNGTGNEAFENLSRAIKADPAIFENGAASDFDASKPFTVVMFTAESDAYLYVEKILWDGEVLSVAYRVVPHLNREVTQHLALIPVEKTSASGLKVELLPFVVDDRFADLGQPPPDTKALTRLVSQPIAIEPPDPR